MNKRLSNFYLVIAIIGIITAIPVIGGLIDIFNILTFILLGFSIYVLVKQAKGSTNKVGAILMIVSCALSLIGGLIVLGSIGSMSAIDVSNELSSYEAGQALGSMIGGSIIGMIFTFPAWVIKIISIVFVFKASSDLKKI